MRIKAFLLVLLVPLVLGGLGCQSRGEEGFDPQTIAKDQPGTAPPPMQPPGTNPQ